jgi:oligopeptide transport system permease protein
MVSYIGKRLLLAIPTLFIIITLSFFLIRVAPGGPFDLERPLEPKVMENLRHMYHLDRPVAEQYVAYLWSIAHGDLGPSFYWRDFSVGELFAGALPISARLGLCAIVLAVVVGGSAGVCAALRQNTAVDYAVTGCAALGLTIPNFVVAPILQLIFGLGLSWLPVGGFGGGSWRNLVLPLVTLSLPQVAIFARLTRASMLEVLTSNPIRTLHANGMPPRIILKHCLRGAALPIVSYLGPATAAVMTGSIVVENVFAIPGVGRYFVDGALNRDYPLVMGTVILAAVLVIVLNLLVDLLYAALDPRVRYE